MSAAHSKLAPQEVSAVDPGIDAQVARLGPSLVAHYPGPLALAGPDGSLRPLNQSGRALVAALEGVVRPLFETLLSQATKSGIAQSEAIRLSEERLGAALSIFVVPIDAAPGAMPQEGTSFFVLGRDATLDRNLREALIESRRRYKDLVECSSDFVWETAPDGSFDFVTARGALGYPPEHLVGSFARDLLDRRRTRPDPFPFEAREPTEDAEVWFRSADGDAVCMLVSSVPLYDADGQWEGARGVCKDVTQVRMRDEALARARAREALLARIVRTIRDEVEPDRLLDAAANAVSEAMGSNACWIYRSDAAGTLTLASECANEPAPAAERLTPIERTFEEIQADDAGGRLFAIPAFYRDRRNGIICIARADRRGLSDDERDLLIGVADQLGIALQQIEAQETLLALSRTDELTGLLNRRAFVVEAEAGIARARRTKTPCALLYVDLDNFKAVNDQRGHSAGDAALKALAALLLANVRSRDYVGRLGGDEFAVWLDQADTQAAGRKAHTLTQEGRALARFSEGLAKPLSTSIGVAVFDPASDETLDDLFARADAAMYAAKQAGKGQTAVAPPQPPARRTAP